MTVAVAAAPVCAWPGSINMRLQLVKTQHTLCHVRGICPEITLQQQVQRLDVLLPGQHQDTQFGANTRANGGCISKVIA